MHDPEKPTNQFHPYQRPDAVPQIERRGGATARMLRRLGIARRRTDSANGPPDLSATLGRLRALATRNPGRLMGAIAVVAIGAGLLRQKR